MAKVIVYHVHPGQKFSRANKALARAARRIDDISFVDLYSEYPRHDIDVQKEQARLLTHDVIVFQFPLYWYSTPSLLKEWQDLVLQHGFAYGHGGDKLAGKTLQIAITAGGSDEAYSMAGYQHYPLRDFLRPLEQTARLCGMAFPAPYVLYQALQAAEEAELAEHVAGYKALLTGWRDETYASDTTDDAAILTAQDLIQPQKVL